MKNNLKQIYSALNWMTLDVVKASSASTLVRVAGMAAGLFVSIFLGRTLGVEGFGIISLANKFAGVVIIFCLLGLKQVIVKEVAIGYKNGDRNRVGQTMYSSYLMIGFFTLALSLILVVSSPYLAKNVFDEPLLTIPFIISFAILVPQAFSRIFASAMVGFNKIWQSNLVDNTLSLGLIGIILILLYLVGIEITIVLTVIVYAIGRIAVTASMGIYWRKIFRGGYEKRFKGIPLLKSSAPLILVGASAIVASNADTLMLGWLKDAKEVGLYVVAAKVALLTSFFLQVTNSALAPKIATLYDKKKTVELQKLIQSITFLLIILGLVPLLLFLLAGDMILMIWGEEFAEAYTILIILSLGQFFNISTGAAGLTLILCGKEKIQGYISVIFVFLNLILNYLLIIQYGAAGAATATAITVAGENFTRVWLVKKHVGISTVPSISFVKKLNG